MLQQRSLSLKLTILNGIQFAMLIVLQVTETAPQSSQDVIKKIQDKLANLKDQGSVIKNALPLNHNPSLGIYESSELLDKIGTGYDNLSDKLKKTVVESKIVKKNKQASTEQEYLKEKLLELVSKAAGGTSKNEKLLRFNLETNDIEEVHPDPEAVKSRRKLEAALRAIHPRKLSVKKLRHLFEDGESNEETASTVPDEEPQVDLLIDPAAEVEQPHSDDEVEIELVDCEKEDEQEELYKITGSRYKPSQILEPSKIEEFKPYRVQIGEHLSAPASAPEPVTTPTPQPTLSEADYTALIEAAKTERIKSQLDSRLRTIDKLLHFDQNTFEDMHQIPNEHLTPLQANFKNLILCNAYPAYCNRPLHFVIGV